MSIQEEIDERYKRNCATVEKISELLGLQLFGFNPEWSFESTIYTRSYSISDDFMGKVALILGYEWEFDPSDEDVKNEIKKSEDHIRDLELRSEETSEAHEHILNLIKGIPDTDENKVSIKNSMNSISKFEETSIDEAKRWLIKPKKILEIRNNLKQIGIGRVQK